MTPTWLILIGSAYLAGSIPFGVMISRARGVNIRDHGSGNIGATNVSRTLGRQLGLLCLFLDVLKGAAPVLVAGSVMEILGSRPETAETWLWLTVASATVAGHVASPFLRFTGGKGVATTLGAMLGMWPILTIPAGGAMLVWIIGVKSTRYVSCGSILAVFSIPVFHVISVLLLQNLSGDSSGHHVSSPILFMTLVLAVAITWLHRSNIMRIRLGTEPRLGDPR